MNMNDRRKAIDGGSSRGKRVRKVHRGCVKRKKEEIQSNK